LLLTLIKVIRAGLILLLLAVFLAQLLAPAVNAVQRRVLTRRRRPIARAWAIAAIYVTLGAAGGLSWLALSRQMRGWARAAPLELERMIDAATRTGAELERLVGRLPLPPAPRRAGARGVAQFFHDLSRDAHAAFADLNGARPLAWTLLVVPFVAFVLLNSAHGFRRSALRVLPHGHLQWRGEEYLRDVNSALAGYLRAQLAAGLIVGLSCLVGFSALGLSNAGALGAAAGVLELVPVIGPLIVGLIAVGQAGPGAAAVVTFLIALRVVQDYVVYPRLIRRGMHLPAVAVVLAVWIGAGLNGAAGVVLAIPAAGFLSVSLRHWRDYHAIEALVRAAGRADHESV